MKSSADTGRCVRDNRMKILGCDCSSKLIGYVLLDDGKVLDNGVLLGGESKDMNTRAEKLWTDFDWLLQELIDSDWTPNAVYIEQAIYVQNIKATLGIDAVINAVRFCCFKRNIPYVIIDNRSWKKDVIGNGNASKEDIAKFANIKWPETFTTQDECDAACLALYGERRLK